MHSQKPSLEAGEKRHFSLPNFRHFPGITSAASSIVPVLAMCRALGREKDFLDNMTCIFKKVQESAMFPAALFSFDPTA